MEEQLIHSTEATDEHQVINDVTTMVNELNPEKESLVNIQVTNNLTNDAVVNEDARTQSIIESIENALEDTEIKEIPIEQSSNEDRSENNPVRRRESTNTSIVLKCLKCDLPAAKKKKDVLTCHVCKGLVHYNCTRLPVYMLYSLSKGSKKYSCESGTAPSDEFLQTFEMRYGKTLEVNNEDEHVLKSSKTDPGLGELERRVNDIAVTLEKFDLQRITENLKSTFEKIEKSNSSINENLNHMKNERKESMICKHECTSSEANQNFKFKEIEELKQQVESYKKSYELLMDAIGDKDKLINSLSTAKENQSKSINQKDEIIMKLNKEIVSYKDEQCKLNEEKEKTDDLRQNISILKNSYDEKLSEVTEKCITNATNSDRKQDIINLLTTQLKEAQESKKKLEDNIETLVNSNKAIPTANIEEKEETVKVKEDRPKVIILHDSLFKRINESMMSRENVEVKKVWSPDFENMTKELDTMTEQVDTIVIQALTRDLKNMSIPDIEANLQVITEKATKKSKSVVISTIVGRSDNEKMRRKAEVVNSYIKYSFIDNPKVKICDNSNLRDDKFRINDGIHLVDHGTSRLANNTKFAVAKALNITVQRKTNDNRSTRYNRYDHSHDRWHDDDRWYEYDKYEDE